jgi:hypothetical protein
MTDTADKPQWVFVLIPKVTNSIYDTLKKINKQTMELGWVKKFADITFIGSSSTDIPLRNILDRERMKQATEYAMKRSLRVGEDVPFRVVEGITPMISAEGMGLILESPFLTHLSSALGFKTNNMFFLVLCAPPPGSKWSEEIVRAGVRMVEDPEDGQFHCIVHPSQWSIGVIDGRTPDIINALLDLENVIPETYIKVEMERQISLRKKP